MKTLEEVKAHLAKKGYNPEDMPRIEGFLFGSGLFEGDEFEIEYMGGTNSFFDFKDWFNGKDEKKSEIDWSEFGFGDFIHVQNGIDAVLLGGIHDGRMVCVNDRCEVKCFLVNDETRPCNEEEMESFIKKLNKGGISFCFVNNEFVSKKSCEGCIGCDVKEQNGCDINELFESYAELCRIADSMSDDNPFKGVAKSIVECFGKMVDEVKDAEKDDSELIDELEIGAKDAIENIIANIHAGTMDEKERKNVVSALNGLVELGKMYE